jgi:hypothetical protein
MYRRDLVQKVKKQLEEAKKAVVIRWRRRPVPKPVPKPVPTPAPKPSPSPLAKPIEHLLNDPTTPDLVNQVTVLPIAPQQTQFLVRGYKGGGYPKGSQEYQAANAYVTVAETLKIANSYGGEDTLPHWARTNTLNVIPRAGVDLNAYYDGRALQFFYASHPSFGSIFTVDAADIVSHECGHAVLDCFRPDLWNSPYVETGAFHEAFGDFCALIHALHHDEMINRMVQETGGDLSKSNIVSRLAEQFGAAIYKIDPNGRSPDCLRNAVNNFVYTDPLNLSEDTPDNQLSSEVHNFSRVMSGALYDGLVAIYNSKRREGISPLDAVRTARDTIHFYVIRAIRKAPLNPKFYESVLKTVLWVDKTVNGGKYYDVLKEVFVKRGIVSPSVVMLSDVKCPNHYNIVKGGSFENIKLSSVILSSQSGHHNPLYGVSVELANESAHFYDHKGVAFDHCSIGDEECYKAAQQFVDYLHRTKSVGPDSTTPWEISNGKLVRTRTCCCKEI